MLSGQISKSFFERLAGKLQFSLGALSVQVDAEGKASRHITKTIERIEKEIQGEQCGLIGEDRPYIMHSRIMRAGVWGNGKGLSTFCDVTREPYLALVGSPDSMVGAPKSSTNVKSIDGYVSMFFSQAAAMTPSSQDYIIPRTELAPAIEGIYEVLPPVASKYTFLAKSIHSGPCPGTDKPCVIASPIYVRLE